MIDVVRKVSYQNNLLKSGIWEKTRGNLLQQKTLGIIGLGEIGKNLVQACMNLLGPEIEIF